MKKYFLYAVILLAVPMLFSACKSDPKSLMSAHAWTFDPDAMKADMLANANEEEKALMESMWPMMKQAMKAYKLTYNADGTYKMETPMGSEEGTWEIVDGNTLRQVSTGAEEGGNEPVDLEIVEISSSKMVLKEKSEEGRQMIFIPAKEQE